MGGRTFGTLRHIEIRSESTTGMEMAIPYTGRYRRRGLDVFIFNLRPTPLSTTENDQKPKPTSTRYQQVSQATSLRNLRLIMPSGAGATHYGIFTKNGSDSFVLDLGFEGDADGWSACMLTLTCHIVNPATLRRDPKGGVNSR